MDINDLLKRPAEEFGNDESLEEMWAMKAFEHADIYFNLLRSVDPKLLRLTPIDDVLYIAFRQEFPKLSVSVINEEEMKNSNGKIKWRIFCEQFKNSLEDYNFGTLLRAKCAGVYDEMNTILVPRVQFLAIEIARNREGFNDIIRQVFKSQGPLIPFS